MNASFKATLCALGRIVIGAAGSTALYAEGSAVPAYYVAEIDVHDMYKTYASQVGATLAPYGGQYLAAGGRTKAVEGAPPPNRIAILQFPSMDKAGAWYLTYPLISAAVKMLPNWAAFARASANFAMSGASLCSGMLGINS